MIPADRAHLLIAADSHPGTSGKINEDRYAVAAFRTSSTTSHPQQAPLPVVFAILADGVGGHNAGEVAAEAAVETISHAIASSELGDNPLSTLQSAVVQASQSILALSEANDQHKGMGSTCASCLVLGSRLFIAYVGDSRIYLIRNNHIQQLTIDHTWIQEAIQTGVLTADQARGHPNAHIIRRFLGSRQPVEPDLRLRLHPSESDEQMQTNQGMNIHPGDQVILCSDGLTDLVRDEEILNAFQSKKLTAAIAALINLANSRGGHDNITIIALQVPARLSPNRPLPAPPANRRTSPNWTPSCLVAGIIVLIIGILILVGLYIALPIIAASPTP